MDSEKINITKLIRIATPAISRQRSAVGLIALLYVFNIERE